MTDHEKKINDTLIALGFSSTAETIDRGDWDRASKHKITLTIGNQSYTTEYTSGPGNRVDRAGNRQPIGRPKSLFDIDTWRKRYRAQDPDLVEITWCLVSDAQCVMGAESFEDFCDSLGYDNDSRTAERVYNACRDIRDFFTRAGADLESLTELFQDY